MNTYGLIISFFLCLLLAACGSSRQITKSVQQASAPGQASYRIGEELVQLNDGRAEEVIVPGSASKKITTMIEPTAYGDLNGDGVDDAAVLLLQQSGGSGSFYYLAAALATDQGFTGTNAFFLGDRIVTDQIEIRDEQIVVLYRDRSRNESMAIKPTISSARYLRLVDDSLVDDSKTDRPGEVVQGWTIVGHEVRSFMPCNGNEQSWLLGESPALPEIKTAYEQVMRDSSPYLPLFMTLAGESVVQPVGGFGRDYQSAFRADRFLQANPQGACSNDLIEVERPAPGESVTSPLNVTGRARGNWYFEGDFPLLLVDGKGQTLARGFAVAQEPWMTKDWVPFVGSLEVPAESRPGLLWLVLQKDNPSDRRDLDGALVIPVLTQ